MLSRMIAGSFGIGCVAWLPALPSIILSVLFIIPFLLLLMCNRHRVLQCVVLALLGAVWAISFGHGVIKSLLPIEMEVKSLWVVGTVVGLPETTVFFGKHPASDADKNTLANSGQKFDLALTSPICTAVGSEPSSCYYGVKKLRLSWRGVNHIQPGQNWRLLVRLKRPHTLANPGGFDYQTWLVQRRIGAVGYVREDENNVQLTQVRWSIDRLRNNAALYLQRILSTSPYLGIYKALLLGDKRDIEQTQWDLFARTGTTHLMVISGLHVGLISMLVFVIARSVSVLLYRSVASERVAAVCAISSAAVYSAAAGFSLPTQRALIMVSIWMLCVFTRREMSPNQGLITALFICLVIDPLAPVSASFWLSFVAVAMIFYGTFGRRSHKPINATWQNVNSFFSLRSQYLVFIGLFPVLFIIMGQASLISPLANTVAVPLFSVLVVPGTLIAALLSGWEHFSTALPWLGLDWLLNHLFSYLHFIDQHTQALSLTATVADTNQLPCYLLALLGMLIVLLPKGVPLRYCGMLLILPLLLSKPEPLAAASVEVTVLDVGQGLSVVVKTKSHTLVFDVGAAFNDSSSIANNVLLPFLRSNGINAVDRLVLSHGDNDHAGGWKTLIKHLSVAQLDYGQWLNGFENTQASPCLSAEKWQWDGVEFEYLYPLVFNAHRQRGNYSANNLSCVLKISTAQVSFLLTGDIEREVERVLINKKGTNLHADVLVAPHHGSLTSSSWPFIKAVEASHVVMSSGYRNRFGHPKAIVVKRYQSLGARIHNTSEHGAIRFRAGAEQLLTVYHYRESFRHYWFRDG